MRPPATMISVPAMASGSRVVSRNRDTLAMLGQRFAAKPKRGDGGEISRRADLAGGVPFQRKQRVIPIHPAAIIDHANKRNPAAPDAHFDFARAGIDAVLDQLFYDRGRPLDHFAGGHLAGKDFRQQANAAHIEF